MRTLSRVLAVVGVSVIAYVGITAIQVWQASHRDQVADADAIVVLGAAQYAGRPSPALRARLDHAAALYEQGRAPVVWVTGGKRPGDTFSEASASDLYLQDRGVPRDALRLEVHGANTYESLAAAARELRREEHHDVLLVSDPWHSYRVLAIAEEVGLRPRVSPAEAQVNRSALRRLTRETIAVAVGRVIGYRRLTNLNERR